MLMSNLSLVTETRASTRIITLNRPSVRNAMSQQLQKDLQAAFEEALSDEGVRVVVLTGSGKAFCAGLDLSELKTIRERSTEENRADSARFAQLLSTIYNFPKPVVAALNGHAIAGGAGLASVCDLAVMSEEAKFGYTESRIGFVAALVSVFLVRQVGEKQARDLLLSARLLNAQETLSMGLVNHVVPASQVLEKALELAATLAANAPSSLNMTKALLAAVPSLGLQEGLRYATELNALARTTDDLNEGVSAFLEKREPKWR